VVTVFAVLLPLLGLAAVIWICYRMIVIMARSDMFNKLLGW
jgi:hypothetical protein